MFKRVITSILFFLLIVSNNAFADTKIGVVKLDILFKEIPIYKESQNNLKKEFKPKADELKKIETSWNKLNDDYLKNERVMSKNDRKAKIAEFSIKQKTECMFNKLFYLAFSNRNTCELINKRVQMY